MIPSQDKRCQAMSTCFVALGESCWPLYTIHVYMVLE